VPIKRTAECPRVRHHDEVEMISSPTKFTHQEAYLSVASSHVCSIAADETRHPPVTTTTQASPPPCALQRAPSDCCCCCCAMSRKKKKACGWRAPPIPPSCLHTHARTRTHAHIHIHIHMHTHAQAQKHTGGEVSVYPLPSSLTSRLRDLCNLYSLFCFLLCTSWKICSFHT